MRRHRQRRRFRLGLRLWAIPLLAGLAARLVLGSSDPDEVPVVTYQTVRVPISPLQIDVGGKAHSDASQLIEAKGTLTHAVYHLLHSRYGDCLHHVDLDLSLEQNSAIDEPNPHFTRDHDPMLLDGFANTDLPRVQRDSEGEEKVILTAKGTATFQCKSTDMPRISIKELDEIVKRSNETIQHVATVAFAAPSSTGSLYQSLVKIAFNASVSTIDSSISDVDGSVGKVR